jgi:predicted outer membrane lipoprotein
MTVRQAIEVLGFALWIFGGLLTLHVVAFGVIPAMWDSWRQKRRPPGE